MFIQIFVQKGLKMALVNTINKASGQVLQTYKARKGNITHVLTTEISGVDTGKRIVNCDSFGEPKKIIDVLPGKRKDIYTKASDGSTILQTGKDYIKLTHIAFNNLCERVFK